MNIVEQTVSKALIAGEQIGVGAIKLAIARDIRAEIAEIEALVKVSDLPAALVFKSEILGLTKALAIVVKATQPFNGDLPQDSYAPGH